MPQVMPRMQHEQLLQVDGGDHIPLARHAVIFKPLSQTLPQERVPHTRGVRTLCMQITIQMALTREWVTHHLIPCPGGSGHVISLNAAPSMAMDVNVPNIILDYGTMVEGVH